MSVDSKRAKSKKDDIRKRTPIEQAIAEQKDPNARWEARMRERGFKKTTFWVPADQIEAVKAYVRDLTKAAS